MARVLPGLESHEFSMIETETETHHSYHYQTLDMHAIDCETLLLQNTPEALILAILSDFGDYTGREVVQRILQGLQVLTGDQAAVFRDYLLMLEILSSNRDLKQILKEEVKMLSQVKYSDLTSYELGMEDGLQEGMVKGIEKGMVKGIWQGEAFMLQKLLQVKFGSLPNSISQRIQAASSEELLYWSERLLSANSLAEIFTEH